MTDEVEAELTEAGLQALAGRRSAPVEHPTEWELQVAACALARHVPAVHEFTADGSAVERSWCECRLVLYPAVPADAAVRQEWLVVGKPGSRRTGGVVIKYPPYRFVFGSPSRLAAGKDRDPEAAAREFMAPILARGDWGEQPRLSARTVVEGPWQARE